MIAAKNANTNETIDVSWKIINHNSIVTILWNSQNGVRVEIFSFLYAYCSRSSEKIWRIAVINKRNTIKIPGIWKSNTKYHRPLQININMAHKNWYILSERYFAVSCKDFLYITLENAQIKAFIIP